ncbi:EfeM/EfeO family lipoprotein [Streptacidiphilus fuscans]|uniref:EfeM/EfeO family lipoprotein n=1 Tax=Streptacidiphilus fuscans TaxID=2789292 RepID=A0A931B482_9ACTN|nr:EfeM/EfeO family lipoprotein [Streptacidiphilus fuscans]MBF9070915.1 EfeM/EfeO family lipoprotein [Streptacidiphilus fuscans]
MEKADRRGTRPGRRGRYRTGVAVVAAALALAGLAAWELSGGAQGSTRAGAASGTPVDYPTLPHTAVQISPSACGAGWTHPAAGLQVFDVTDTGVSPADVDLVEPATGAVVAEVEGLAPNRSRPLLVHLAPGTYAFRCLQQDVDAVTGPTVTVKGPKGAGTSGAAGTSSEAGSGTPAVVPVTEQDLIPATLAYQHWVAGQLPTLVSDVTALQAAVSSGDVAGARQHWLTAHLDYERLGAAYGAFGDVDEEINGPRQDSTGFHALEYGLWHGASASSLAPVAAKLLTDVQGLQTSWATVQLDPLVLGVRAHEIVENAIEFELSGRTDYGSDSNLATVQANLDGTAEVLSLLRPLLTSRVDVPAVDAAMAAARSELATLNGAPLASLAQVPREQLNAVFGNLVEQLAPVAAVLDVRRTT